MNLTAPRTFASWIIGGISLLILLVIGFLLLIPREVTTNSFNVSAIPLINAVINATVAVCLLVGYRFIRRGQIKQHRAAMILAFALSSLFLVLYVILHSVAGSTPFTGTGLIRPVYFIILISHIILSAAVLPLALTTLYRGWISSFEQHRRIARWTFPIWLYTSVTGVLVYLILHHWPAS
jgi:putative membrane protein